MNNQEIKKQEAKENESFLNWIKSPAFQLQSSSSKTSDLELYMIAKNREIADLKAVIESQAQQPKGMNTHGLDARYFHGKLSMILRDIESYKPEEMHRELSRLADVLATLPVPAMSQFATKADYEADLQSQAQQTATPERNMLRPPTINLSTCFVGGLINRDTPEVAIGKINKELEKSIVEYFKAQQGHIGDGNELVQEPYAYDVPTEDGTELAYAIYFTKYNNPLPEGAIPLYVIPPAPEAQPDRIAEIGETMQSQAQQAPMKLFAYMEDVEDLRYGKDGIRLYKHKAAVLDPVEVIISLPPAPEGDKP